VLIDQSEYTSHAAPIVCGERLQPVTTPESELVWSGMNHGVDGPRQTKLAFGLMGRSAWHDLGAASTTSPTFLPFQQELNWLTRGCWSRASIWPASGWDKGVRWFPPFDAVNFFVEDPALRDNPERTPEMGLP